MGKTFPFYKQLDEMDCGPACLKMVASFYGGKISAEVLREKAFITKQGVNLGGLSNAAEAIGLQSLALQTTYEMLRDEIPLPCIAHWRERHFVVVYKIDKNQVHVADPAFGLINYSKLEFIKGWISQSDSIAVTGEGVLLVLEPTPEFYEVEDESSPKNNFNFLIPFIKPHSKLILQLVIGLFIGSLIQLILPFLTQAIVDVGISQGNFNFINLVLMGQLILFFAQTTTTAIRSWLLLHVTSRINISLLSNFLIKLMKLPIAFFDTKSTGDLFQRIQDNSRIQNFLSTASLNILFSALNILVFGGVLFYYSTSIFLIFLCCTVVNFIWVYAFMKRRAALDYKIFDQASGSQSSTIQLLNGMQEIKLNNSEKRRRWEWELIQVKLFKLSIKSLTLNQFQDIGGGFIIQLMGFLVTFLAAKEVIAGHFTLGAMLSIQYIIGQLNSPVSNFTTFIQSYQDARISLERLSEIHNKENETGINKDELDLLPISKEISFKNVNFRYGAANNPLVLENINLIIPEGKVTAIVGASGSGKTTLLKLILRFHSPISGIIEVGTKNLNNYNVDFWRKNIGVVMQDGYLFADSIARNITESDSNGILNKEKLLKAAQIANIEEFIESLPKGYKTRIGSSGTGLSGGQQQRIFIARAIYKDAPYLLFDEATSSLDANNERLIMRKLEEYCKNRTVVVVAHRLSTVLNADQIIVLEKGRIIEQGNHTDLSKLRGAYYTLIKNQLELGQ